MKNYYNKQYPDITEADRAQLEAELKAMDENNKIKQQQEADEAKINLRLKDYQ